MPDTSIPPEDGDGHEERMVILRINATYWLAEGKDYLNPMLVGGGYFPKPVVCIRFADPIALRTYLGPDRPVTSCWGINPDIIERLRQDGHLAEQDGPED